MATENQAGSAQGAAPTTTQSNNDNTPARSENVAFMTVAQFKDQIGAASLSVLRNPNTNKLWMVTEGGANYKVQQDIDNTKDIRVLIPENDLDQACLVNVDGGAEAIFSL